VGFPPPSAKRSSSPGGINVVAARRTVELPSERLWLVMNSTTSLIERT